MRIIYFDYLKLFASFLIVCYHIKAFPLHELAYSGLFIFLIVGVFLQATSGSGKHAGEFLLEKRILIPWILWSVFYLLLNEVCRHCYFVEYSWNQLFVGGNIHLWYLPFIYLVYQIIRKLDFTSKGLMLFSLSVYFILQIFANYWRPFSLSLIVPLPQYLHALSGVLIGIIYASIEHVQSKQRIAIFCVATLVILIASLITFNLSGMGYPLFIATLTFAVFKLPLFARVKTKAAINKYSYGVYLIHPFIILVVMKLSKVMTVEISPIFYPVVIFICSILSLMMISFLLKDKAKYLY